MKRALKLLFLLLLTQTVLAQPVSDPLTVNFEQHLGEQVPLDLRLTDHVGREIAFGDMLGSKPVVLSLGYYECPMLCHKVQDGLIEGLADCTYTVGKEFQVITVSIDPSEDHNLAAAKRKAYLNEYEEVVSAEDWPFLVGSQDNLRRLQKAVGFRSAQVGEQIAHPAGLIVLTPSGKVSSYLQGLRFPSESIKGAVDRAQDEKQGSFLQPVVLLCYQYDPATGKYSLAIYRVVQLLGLATVLLLGGFVLYRLKRDRGARG